MQDLTQMRPGCEQIASERSGSSSQASYSVLIPGEASNNALRAPHPAKALTATATAGPRRLDCRGDLSQRQSLATGVAMTQSDVRSRRTSVNAPIAQAIALWAISI